MNHSTIGSAPHNPTSTTLENPSPDSDQPEFLAGYDVGWRHGVLDILDVLTDAERATLLRQALSTKER